MKPSRHLQHRSSGLHSHGIEPLESRIAPAVIFVNNPTDAPQNGQVDLRQALATADQDLAMHPGVVNKIEFHLAKTAPHTETILTLGGTALSSNGDVDIIGPGAGKFIISGNQASGVFNLMGTAKPVSISGVSIVAGYLGNGGGGIYSSEPLILKNVVISANGSVTFGAGINIHGSGDNPALSLINCQVTGNSPTSPASSGIFVYDGGNLTITNSIISGNTIGITDVVAASTPTLAFISKSAISGNAQRGIIFKAQYGTSALDITGSNISGNDFSRAKDGGGVYIATGKATINSSVIENNTGLYSGGGVYAITPLSLSIVSSTISGNKTRADGTSSSHPSGGGGVGIITDDTPVPVSIIGSHITDNTSVLNGGGVLAYGDVQLTVKSSTISGNSANPVAKGGQGGGIDGVPGVGHYTPTLSVTSSVIANNTAYTGGGIKIFTTQAFTLSSTKITGNAAVSGGAGVYTNGGGTATITNCTVTGNAASGFAGGLDLASNSHITIKGGVVSGNTAQVGAGVALYDIGVATITGVKITGNSAYAAAGGVLNYGTTPGHVTIQAAGVFANSAPAGPDFDDTSGDLSTFTFV